jgi:hypothetical protein
MAGTPTYPAITGTATETQASLHLVDASGDLWSENLVVPAAATQAQIGVIASSYAAATQASLYGVQVNRGWFGDLDPQNAEALYRGQVESGINLLYHNIATLTSYSQRLIAPIAATLQGNQDIPLLTATELSDLIVSTLAAKAGFSLISAQYTGRRERKNNPRIRA